MILPITEKQFELRELAQRRHLTEIKQECDDKDGKMSKADAMIIFKHTCKGYESLLDRLWAGDTTDEEIEELKALKPTKSYKPTAYTGELTGGTKVDLPTEKWKENGIFLVDSEHGRRIKYDKSKHCYEYDVDANLSYDDIETMMLVGKSKEGEFYDKIKEIIDMFKTNNISPQESLSLLHDYLSESKEAE